MLNITDKMPLCAAVRCTNSAKIRFLKCYPKDPNRWNEWVAKVKRENWVPADSNVLCEKNKPF